MHAMQTSIGLFPKYYKYWLSAYENSERRVEITCLQLLLCLVLRWVRKKRF